jgi:hypothetical protein
MSAKIIGKLCAIKWVYLEVQPVHGLSAGVLKTAEGQLLSLKQAHVCSAYFERPTARPTTVVAGQRAENGHQASARSLKT